MFVLEVYGLSYDLQTLAKYCYFIFN